MALVIRLRQQGKTNRQSYRLVVTDRRSPRDGKYIENLGWYDPFMNGEKNYLVKEDRVEHWVKHGAILSDNAKILFRKAAPSLLKAIYEKSLAKKIKERKAARKKKG